MIKKSVISTATIIQKDDMPFVTCSVCRNLVSIADAFFQDAIYICIDCKNKMSHEITHK